MKKIIKFLFIALFSINLVACNKDLHIQKDIELKEMRAITELATVECYYHNVAKSDEPTNKTWYEFWKKENIRFWVEYDGIVWIGIDASSINFNVDGEQVFITLPKAIVLDAKVDPKSLTKDSFYYDANSEKPNENDEKKAFSEAQQHMKDSAAANQALLNNAEDNAIELIENYVKSVGEVTGIDYKITWKEIEEISD